MRIVSIFLIFLGCFFASIVHAAQTQETPQSDFKYSGYVDASYNYLLRSNKFVSGINDRLYDLQQNGFTLQQAALTLSYQPARGFGWLINPFIGRDANSLAPYGWNPYYGSQTVGFVIPQAYLQYAIDSFTLRGGSLLATSGAELFNPLFDANFSRGLLDTFAMPGTFLGVRGIYTLNSKFSMYAGINNGWDSIRDFSRQKTLEVSATFKGIPLLTLTGTIYTGMQRLMDNTDSGPVGRRSLFDLVGKFKATEQLELVLNADYGLQSKAALPSGNIAKAVWEGIAGYVNYQFNPTWRTSLRGEIFYDQNGYQTGVRQNLREITLTLGYVPIKNLELQAETRHDFSNVPAFLDTNGVSANSQQQSYALNAIYKF